MGAWVRMDGGEEGLGARLLFDVGDDGKQYGVKLTNSLFHLITEFLVWCSTMSVGRRGAASHVSPCSFVSTVQPDILESSTVNRLCPKIDYAQKRPAIHFSTKC